MKNYLIFDGESEKFFMADELVIYPTIHMMNISDCDNYRGNPVMKIQFDKPVEIINKIVGRTYSKPINNKQHVINKGLIQCKVIPKNQTNDEYKSIYEWI